MMLFARSKILVAETLVTVRRSPKLLLLAVHARIKRIGRNAGGYPVGQLLAGMAHDDIAAVSSVGLGPKSTPLTVEQPRCSGDRSKGRQARSPALRTPSRASSGARGCAARRQALVSGRHCTMLESVRSSPQCKHGAVDLVAEAHRAGEQAARDLGIGELAPRATPPRIQG
jgi:hypothetical protein